MSSLLRTLEGRYMETGFAYGDTSCVLLGHLPAMPIEQFSKFAVDTIVELAPGLDPTQMEKLREMADYARQGVEGKPIASPEPTTTGFGTIDELFQQIEQARAVSDESAIQVAGAGLVRNLNRALGNITVHYAKNPFGYEQNLPPEAGVSVVINQVFRVDPIEFTALTAACLHGGVVGWEDQVGPPQEVVLAVSRLAEAAGLQ